MQTINLKEISKRYDKSETYFKIILCRPEFNQFRTDIFFVFDDSVNFHKMLKHIINLKTKKYKVFLFVLKSLNRYFH